MVNSTLSLKNIILGACVLLLTFFENFIFWILSFGKIYENDLRVIFDQWPKLYLGFDVEPEIWVLKVIYYLTDKSS